MLYTIAVVLLILWVLGLATSYTVGGLLHLLLVVAAIMVVFQLISGRRVGKRGKRGKRAGACRPG